MKRIVLIGTGLISAQHLAEFGAVPECRLVACVDVLPGRAVAFAEANGMDFGFDSVEAALDWGDFDAAINATPDNLHKAVTLQLLAAGKHVLCEKPLAPNYPDALEMTEAAERSGLISMVNLTYRNSPALQYARAMVEAGDLGELRHIEAGYRQSWLVGKAWGDWRLEDKWLWRLSKAHGSTGVLGDVGVHILDFLTYGAVDSIRSLRADLMRFPKAENEQIGKYVLDANDTVAITARMTGGAVATIVATRYATGYLNDLTLTLHGTRGALRVETTGLEHSLLGCLGEDVDNARWQPIELAPTLRNARRFVDALISGVNGDPSFRRAADMQQLIDAAFASDASGSVMTID
jgi:predicted dehydrogenase